MGAQESVKPPRIHCPYDRIVKLVVAGCSWRTMPDRLINKFLGYGYEPTPVSNLKWEFVSRTITIDEKRVCLQIWDSSIYVRFGSLPRSFLRGHHVGFMLLYDVRDEGSFEAAKKLATAPHHVEVDPEMPVMLVGCKCQQKERRQVSYYTAREFVDERGFSIVEVCGKEGVNVELAFLTLVGELLSRNRFEDVELAH